MVRSWKLLVAAPLLFQSQLLLCPEVAHAWVILSEFSTQFATQANLDPISGKLATTGVLFRTAFKDITIEGSSATNCFILVGDWNGFSRALYETPQICTQFGIFPRPANENATQDSSVPLPQGISVGMDGHQGSVATMDFSGNSNNLKKTNPYNLPSRNFPVALSSDSEGGVYVGLHGTGGILPPPAPEDENQELTEIYNYYGLMTYPTKTEHFISPEIVKINMKTREQIWQLELTTTQGRSTIGNVVHLTSRDLLVVAGSSNGKGTYVGAGEWSTNWNGYITLVNATTGIVNTASETPLMSDFTLRVQSQIGKDDYILGMCALDDNIFVVGSTTGTMKADNGFGSSSDGGGFLMMLDVGTFNIRWTQQWYGMGVELTRCVATPTSIYVGGQVPKGISLKEDTTRKQRPSKTQDLIVAVVNATDGSIEWTRQVDSHKTDHLANVLLTGNELIVVGNSLDFEKGLCDIYTFSVSTADGSYDWQGLPPNADPIHGNAALPTKTWQQIFDDKKHRKTVIATATVVPGVLLLLLMAYAIRSRKKSTEHTIPEPDGIIKEQDVSEESPPAIPPPIAATTTTGVV